MRILLIAMAFTALCIAACSPAPKVVQGTVVSHDIAGKVLVLRDDLAPATTYELSLQDAEIGADPVPGDTVRVAYLERDTGLAATRVMNITRQEDVGGKK